MGDVVLIVEKDDRVRLGIRQAFKAHETPLYEVADPFDAMSALGRASFGAVVVSAGKRQLSLRGLCQLARKRHPGVELFIITSPGVTASQIEQVLGVERVQVIAAGTTTFDLARNVVSCLGRQESGFDLPVTNPTSLDDDSDEETRPHIRASTIPAEVAAASRPPAPTSAPQASLSGSVRALPRAGAPAPAVAPSAAITARGPAAPSPVQREPQAARAPSLSSAPLPPDEPLTAPAQPAAGLPVVQAQHNATGEPAPVLEPQPRSAEGAATQEASFTTVIPLSHDEPTATNFNNPLLPSVSGEPSARAPVMDASEVGAGETLRTTPPSSSPSLSDGLADDPTLPMPVWRPPSSEPTPSGGAAVDSGIVRASGFLEQEPTAKMTAWPSSPSMSSTPDVSPAATGEKLPAPINLPPVANPALSPAERALESPPPESTVPETRLVGALVESSQSTSEGSLLDGALEEQAGGPLLMTLLAQEITGVLELVEGVARGRLYFLHGEPVYAEHADGDAGLLQHLQTQQVVPPTFRAILDDGRAIPEGQLLSVLSNRGLLAGEAVHEFLRSFVRARVLALIGQPEGAYSFFEDTTFLDTKPLLKVNPFGLILEIQRKKAPPDNLVRQSSELAWWYAHPRPALAPVSERLRPFVRGGNLHEHVTGQKRVKQLLGVLGLDDLMGTLLVRTLEAAGLITLAEEPMESFSAVELSESTIVQEDRFTLPDSEVQDSASAHETKAREEIFSLYMRLKPLVMPRDVLGVAIDADPNAIQAAYQGRMDALDPKRIPEGSARQLMVSRVEELRLKIKNAYEALSIIEGGSGQGGKTPW